MIKIKVTIPETVIYYETEYEPAGDLTNEEVANEEQQLFQEGKLSWEDVIGNAPRGIVTFEGVEDE